jgi:hypothetical protein
MQMEGHLIIYIDIFLRRYLMLCLILTTVW